MKAVFGYFLFWTILLAGAAIQHNFGMDSPNSGLLLMGVLTAISGAYLLGKEN